MARRKKADVTEVEVYGLHVHDGFSFDLKPMLGEVRYSVQHGLTTWRAQGAVRIVDGEHPAKAVWRALARTGGADGAPRANGVRLDAAHAMRSLCKMHGWPM